jgi:hypothetical protein
MTTDKKVNKIHQKVSSILGMAIVEDDENEEPQEIVPVPDSTEIIEVDNPELPLLVAEMTRLEHVERQTDFVLDHVLPVVQESLAESLRMPPIYKARSIEANAKMLEAVKDLMQLKAEIQFKKIESKMKQAAFTRNKGQVTPITGNTFVFNREELIKSYKAEQAEKMKNED